MGILFVDLELKTYIKRINPQSLHLALKPKTLNFFQPAREHVWSACELASTVPTSRTKPQGF